MSKAQEQTTKDKNILLTCSSTVSFNNVIINSGSYTSINFNIYTVTQNYRILIPVYCGETKFNFIIYLPNIN